MLKFSLVISISCYPAMSVSQFDKFPCSYWWLNILITLSGQTHADIIEDLVVSKPAQTLDVVFEQPNEVTFLRFLYLSINIISCNLTLPRTFTLHNLERIVTYFISFLKYQTTHDQTNICYISIISKAIIFVFLSLQFENSNKVIRHSFFFVLFNLRSLSTHKKINLFIVAKQPLLV
jgi:hypothetical protein